MGRSSPPGKASPSPSQSPRASPVRSPVHRQLRCVHGASSTPTRARLTARAFAHHARHAPCHRPRALGVASPPIPDLQVHVSLTRRDTHARSPDRARDYSTHVTPPRDVEVFPRGFSTRFFRTVPTHAFPTHALMKRRAMQMASLAHRSLSRRDRTPRNHLDRRMSPLRDMQSAVRPGVELDVWFDDPADDPLDDLPEDRPATRPDECIEVPSRSHPPCDFSRSPSSVACARPKSIASAAMPIPSSIDGATPAT